MYDKQYSGGKNDSMIYSTWEKYKFIKTENTSNKNKKNTKSNHDILIMNFRSLSKTKLILSLGSG